MTLDTGNSADGDDATAGEPTEADESAGFANRAARRAKGKGHSQAPPSGNGKQTGGRGTVQQPRQYGARRSGG